MTHMKYTKFFSCNQIRSDKKANPYTVFDFNIIQMFLSGLLVFVYSCFLTVPLVAAGDGRSAAWQEAFALVDKRHRKSAVLKLEALLQTDLSESEKLKIHHALGYNYEKLGSHPKAVRHYAQVISPNYPLADYAVYRLAQFCKRMHNNTEAIKWYAHLVKNYPKSFYILQAKWDLAKLYLDQEHYKTAKPLFIELVEHSQYEQEATFGVARCDEELGDISTAFRVYRQLIKAKHTGNVTKEALNQLKQLVQRNQSFKLTPNDRIHCGLVFFSHRQWKATVAELERIPESADFNTRAQVFYLIGQSYQKLKKYDTAIDKFNAVVALGNESEYLTRAIYQIAQCYRQKRQLSTAVRRLEDFVNVYTSSKWVDEALRDIAQICQEQGKSKAEFKTHTRLLEVAPQSPYVDVAMWRIGWLHFDDGRYEESYNTFKRLKESFPGNRYAMGAHFWMAKIRERQNKPELAQKLYKEVVKARYWYYTARAKAILGIATSQVEPRVAQAAKLPTLQACPEQVPQLMELRLYEDAIAHLNHHINTTAFSESQCFYDLLTCYERLARYDQGQQLAEQALENPTFANPTQQDLEWLQQKLYPRYYAETIEKYAKLYEVDAFLISAMILEESRYNTAAMSDAGARGLMQIMPATGKEEAQKISIRDFEPSMLNQPEVNIQVGTRYIYYLSSQFKGSPMLIIGAYNRGPGWMKRRMGSKEIKDIDEFVERITIRETRIHIKKVINSYDHYIEIYRKTEGPPR